MIQKSAPVLAGILLIFSLKASQAQSTTEVGIRGGLSWPDLYDPERYADFTYNTGFAAGVYFSTNIANSPIVFQPEMLFIQKGFKVDLPIQNSKYRLNYLQIPLLTRFNFDTKSQFDPFIYAGPYIGFNIHTESNAQFIADAPNFIIDAQLDDEVKTMELGIVVGAGIGVGRLDFGLRYEAGLTDVFKNYKGKNHILSLFTGIGF